MPATRIELLQGMPIFGAISDDALRFLLEQTRTVTLRAAEFFFREGDQATGMFVLERGRAAVLKDWKGRQVFRNHLDKGDCFGEMALMDLRPRSASVQAVDDCSAIEITPDHMYRLFTHDAEQFALIQMNMGREVCRRLRSTADQLFQVQMTAADRETAGHRPP